MKRELSSYGYRFVEHIDTATSKNLDDYLPLISAFLNGEGGVILVDVDEGGVDQLIHGITDAIGKRIQPASLIYVREQTIDDRPGILIEVPAGREPPYAYDNIIFNLENGVCKPASMKTVRDWIIKGREGFERWENRFCSAEPSDVVDTQELSTALLKAQNAGRLDPNLVMDDIITGLSAFGAMRQGRFVYAGLVMFAKRPAHIAPQTLVRLTHYAGRRADSEIIETREFNGPICQVIDGARDYIIKHSPRTNAFNSETGNREEKCLYPPFAVREALVNACAHRDYESMLGGVAILLFSDRLEIWNSGKLPDGVTLRALNNGNGVASVLVNPTISNYLYSIGYMERAGRGSALIVEMSKGVKTKVEWKVDKSRGVGIQFRAQNLMTPFDGIKDNQSLNLSIKDVDFMRKMQECAISNHDSGILYKILVGNPNVRRPILMIMTGWTRGVLQRNIDILKKAKLVEYRGSKKSGGFFALPLIRN